MADEWDAETWSEEETENVEYFLNLLKEENFDDFFERKHELLSLDEKDRIQLAESLDITTVKKIENILDAKRFLAYLLCINKVRKMFSDGLFYPTDQQLASMTFLFVQFNSTKALDLIFRYLKIDQSLTDCNGNTALHHVTTVKAAKVLREAGTNLMHRNVFGQTAIHTATQKNKGRLVSYILSFAEKQAETINIQDLDGNTAIGYASKLLIEIMKNDLIVQPDLIQLRIMIQSFLFAGAELQISNKSGETAPGFLLKHFKVTCVEDLLNEIYDFYSVEDANIIEEIVNDLFSVSKKELKEIEVDQSGDSAYEDVEKCFEHLDHTADIQIHAWGKNVSESFTNCALGMLDYMVPIERIRSESSVFIEASGADSIYELLFNFMTEVLYVASCDPYFMTHEIEMVNFDAQTRKLKAKLKGENFDLKRHGGHGTEVKAITYSAMRIEEDYEKCNVWVIVDI